MSPLGRRELLLGAAGLGSALLARALLPAAAAASGRRRAPAFGPEGPYGALLPANEHGIRLPRGFRSRILAVGGFEVPDTGYVWHRAPDGGATFPLRDGWVYVSNAELPAGGGASALRFDRRGEIRAAYPILSGTRRNCAGGATPWGSWLSCEEVADGQVFECDPEGLRPALARPALGRFQHEAVAVDARARRLYLTEDQPDGRLYRFTPSVWRDLSAGSLELAEVAPDGRVRWHPVPNPTPGPRDTPTRHQVASSTAFRGGEGIAVQRDRVVFTTKLDNSVWEYQLASETLRLLYATRLDPAGVLSGVDNVAADRRGGVIVAEDGGDMQLVLLTREGTVAPILQIENQPGSELAGPAFDPSGSRLYLSSQRGAFGLGVSYEIRGPFRGARRRQPHRRDD